MRRPAVVADDRVMLVNILTISVNNTRLAQVLSI